MRLVELTSKDLADEFRYLIDNNALVRIEISEYENETKGFCLSNSLSLLKENSLVRDSSLQQFLDIVTSEQAIRS